MQTAPQKFTLVLTPCMALMVTAAARSPSSFLS